VADDSAWMSVPYKLREHGEEAKRELDNLFFERRPICIVWYRDSKVKLLRNKSRHRSVSVEPTYSRSNTMVVAQSPSKPVVSIHVTFDSISVSSRPYSCEVLS
jgi:hypothetical protein